MKYPVRRRLAAQDSLEQIAVQIAEHDLEAAYRFVDAGGYSSVSEYMRELVRQAKTEKDLEERLLAALDSGDLGQVGPEFFEGLKARAKKAVRGGK